MKNIGVLASHGGSNLQAVIDGTKTGILNASVSVVISNNKGAFALERARLEGIPAICLTQKNDGNMLRTLQKHQVDILVLAGYLKKVNPLVIEAYKDCIFNIHPSLLPKYGGKGMYGLNVHRAVIESGDKYTGATIHRVTGEYDDGEILAQNRVPVMPEDSPESLAARVLATEHSLLVETLHKILAML